MWRAWPARCTVDTEPPRAPKPASARCSARSRTRASTSSTDRLWPGSRSANVDFVIVGPSGVMIVDAKSWGEVTLVDDRIFQGKADVSDRFQNLRSLADRAQTSLAEIGMAPGEIRVVAVFMGKCRLHGTVGGVDLIGEDEALDYILNRGARLRPLEVDAALGRVEELFRPQPVTTNTVELMLQDLVIPTTDRAGRRHRRADREGAARERRCAPRSRTG